MSLHPENVPNARMFAPFPSGDVVGKTLDRTATALLALNHSSDNQKCRARLRWMRDIDYPGWSERPSQVGNVQAIEALTEEWDHELITNNEPPIGVHFLRAFKTTMGLLITTGFLDTGFRDYSKELAEMRQYPLSAMSSLVNESERSLQTHPNVQVLLSSLVDLQESAYEVPAADTRTSNAIRLGTYLPYTLASTTQMERLFAFELTDNQIARYVQQAKDEFGL